MMERSGNERKETRRMTADLSPQEIESHVYTYGVTNDGW
jgi:hypothetical protein